jgi:hypothetical protein
MFTKVQVSSEELQGRHCRLMDHQQKNPESDRIGSRRLQEATHDGVCRRSEITNRKPRTFRHTDTMLYKMIAAALLVSSGEALKLDGMGMGMSRRAAVAKAASLALPLAAMPAFALNRAEDAEIYKVRARCRIGRGPRA